MFARKGAFRVEAACTHSTHLGAAGQWQLAVRSDLLLLGGDPKGLTGKPPWTKKEIYTQGPIFVLFLLWGRLSSTPRRRFQLGNWDWIFLLMHTGCGCGLLQQWWASAMGNGSIHVHFLPHFHLQCRFPLHILHLFHTHTIPVQINGSPMCRKATESATEICTMD